MNILMVLEGVFPQDERVEKEIASLRGKGHNVRIATYSFNPLPFKEEFEGYIIYRRRLSKFLYKVSAAALVLPFYFSFWRKYLRNIYSEWKFDAIHVHDLPLAKMGYEFKRDFGTRFVADQHEFYSNWIVKTAHYNSFPGKIIKLLSNWKKYEYRYLQQADLICTVEQPLKDLYIRLHRLEPEKIVVIPNTPLKKIYGKKIRKREDKAFILFYCGGLDILRGLETPIRSLLILKDKIPNIKISLVGKVNKHFDPIAYAGELGLAKHIEFRGWVHYHDLPDEIDESDICFFTPPANRNEINNTIATKIYQYMAREKPVIVGQASYMKEFIEKNGIGISIDEKSPEEFAGAVLKIYESPELGKEFSSNARKKVDNYYWENTVKALEDFYANATLVN